MCLMRLAMEHLPYYRSYPIISLEIKQSGCPSRGKQGNHPITQKELQGDYPKYSTGSTPSISLSDEPRPHGVQSSTHRGWGTKPARMTVGSKPSSLSGRQ